MTGAIVQLRAEKGSQEWANVSNPIGQYLYQSFDDDDYQEFLSGKGVPGAPSGFGVNCGPNSSNYALCGNFNKPRMALGGAKHRQLAPTLVSLWQSSANHGGKCLYLVEATLPDEAHILGGAPSAVWTKISLSSESKGKALGLELEYLAFSKTSTRLPESIFVQFKPAVEAEPAPAGWSLESEHRTPPPLLSSLATDWLNIGVPVCSLHLLPLLSLIPAVFNDSSIILDPMDVMPSPHGSGGAPHTRCVSGVRWQGAAAAGGSSVQAPSMRLSSKDVPCVCTGTPTPFPTPRNEPPKMADGVSYNICE
jgi:hypothetical protein